MNSNFPSSFQPIESKPEMPKSFQPMQNGEEIQPERTRIQSLTAAPIKGVLKGLQETYGFLSSGPIPGKLAERAIEEAIPTEKKAPERYLERAGKIGTFLASPGNLRNKLIRGGIATVGGQVAEDLGFGKGAQTAIETGALLAPTSLKGAKNYVSSLYSEARKFSKNANVTARNLVFETRQMIKELEMGGSTPSKVKALEKLKEILSKVKKGKIAVDELGQFKSDLHEVSAGLYSDQTLDKQGRELAKRNLQRVSKIVDKSLQEYGKTNPEWNKFYRQANEAHGAIANSKKVGRWIARIFKQHPHASGAALGASLFGHALNPKAAIGVIGGAGLLKTGEFIARIAKSKVLRKYYADAIKQAVKESPGGFLNAMKKLSENVGREKVQED